MGSGVPYDLSAANVPLVENVIDIPAGNPSQLTVLVTECLPTDLVTSMVLTAKIATTDSDEAITTIIATITPTPASAGQVTTTSDPTVWQGVFLLTDVQTTMVLNAVRVYAVQATINRGGVSSTRTVQTGVLSAVQGANDVIGLYFDGQAFADGTFHAGGLLQ